MSTRSEQAKARDRLVRQMLLAEWDPIGIRDEARAQDEYDDYVAAVSRLLVERRGPDQIADYLVEIEQNRMGLRPDPGRARRVAKRLIAALR